jgi:hypothetical protein
MDGIESMGDTGQSSQECVGNEALCPSDSACRISLPIDLRGHVRYRVFIVECQDPYARIRFTAPRRLESLRGQFADKSTSRSPRGKSTCEAGVKLWRQCRRGRLIFRSPRTGAPIAPSRRYSSQDCRNPFRSTAGQYRRRNGTCQQEQKCASQAHGRVEVGFARRYTAIAHRPISET